MMKKYVTIILIFSFSACINSDHKKVRYGTVNIDKYGNRTINTSFSIQDNFNSTKAGKLYEKALMFSQNQENDSALIYMKMANKTEKENKLILKDLGNIFAEMDQIDSAKYYTLKSIELDSSYSWALNNFGLLLYREYEYSQAIEYYNKALRLEPENGLFHVNKALALHQLGQVDSCCIHLKIAQKLNSYDSKKYIKELLKHYDCK